MLETTGTTNGRTASGTSDVGDSAAADPTDDAYHNNYCASLFKGWFSKNNTFVGCVSFRAYTGRM